jgi:2-phospho-L-lactate guanylyltransferase
MMIYAVVPVKHLTASKSKLASVLTPKNRKHLTLAMLEDVLTAIRGSTVQEIVVVGSDFSVSELTTDAGAVYIREEARGLNRAISGSILWCMKRGAKSILILPADIPLLSSADINRIIEMAGNAESTMILSPSENGGTNALYLKPPNLIPVSYGPGSFKRHLKQGRRRAARVKLYYSSSVAFDIDSKDDLQKLLRTPSTSLSSQFVAKVLKKNMG